MLCTDELYENLWMDEITSNYVMAVLPSKALKFIHADRHERCYIVNFSEENKVYSRGDGDFSEGDGHVGHWLVLTVHGLHATTTTVTREKELEQERNPLRRIELRDKLAVVEIFDSLGPRNTYNEEITDFISKFGSSVIHSQFLSKRNCGFYTLLYTYYRSRAFTPKVGLEILTKMKESDVSRCCRQLYA